MKSIVKNPLVDAAKGQLFSSYQMLETLVDVCPADVWQGVFNEIPFWYQVYHTVYFVDYWFREDPAARDFPAQGSIRAFRRSLSGFCRRTYIFPARRCASICA